MGREGGGMSCFCVSKHRVSSRGGGGGTAIYGLYRYVPL